MCIFLFSPFYCLFFFFFFNDTATTEIYTLSLHDALPISGADVVRSGLSRRARQPDHSALALALVSRSVIDMRERQSGRSEEHTSELQSLRHLVCRLLLEKKKTYHNILSIIKKYNIKIIKR